MAATLASQVLCTFTWNYQTALTGGATSQNAYTFSYSKTLTNGTGSAGTADLIYTVQTTIAASGTLNIDLVGALADFFGTTITMARLKYIFLSLLTDTTASSITVGNHAAPIALFSAGTATTSIRNGGFFALGCSDATGIAMTGAATDALKILNADGSNTATVQFAAIGSSA